MKITKIGLGTVQFGLDYGISNSLGKTSLQEVKNILAYAKTVGIDTLDTASAYGSAEEVLGDCDIDGFKIVSKFIQGEVYKQYNRSLERLNQPHLYGYMAHRPLELLNDKTWEQLMELKEKNNNLKIGFSLNDVSEIEQLLDADRWPDIVQAPYNVLDKRFEKYFKKLKEKNCEIHSRSTFLQGLFFCKKDELSTHFASVKDYILELQKEKYLAASLLNFSLSNEYIDKVIVGVNSVNQLKENITQIKSFTGNTILEYTKEVSINIIQPSNWKVHE